MLALVKTYWIMLKKVEKTGQTRHLIINPF